VVPPSAAEGFDRVCRVAVVGYQRLDEQMRLKLPLIWSHVFMPPKTCEFPPLLTVFFIAAVGLWAHRLIATTDYD
jgi:hypothetical protein